MEVMKMIRVLSIGNSFSQDAHAWLEKMATSVGIELEAVNLYIGGCSLEKHCECIKTGDPEYDYELNGSKIRKASINDVLKKEKWSIITLQQGSAQSGQPFTYVPYLNELTNFVRKYQPEAKIYIFETWAYELDATHPSFPVYHKNQQEMYVRLRDSYRMACLLINAPVIPVGDVIQQLREHSKAFDYKNGGLSLNRDGFHLDELYGRYAASLTFIGKLFGVDVRTIPFIPMLEGRKTDERLIDIIRQNTHIILTGGDEKTDD